MFRAIKALFGVAKDGLLATLVKLFGAALSEKVITKLILRWLEKLAKSTENTIDDEFVAGIKAELARRGAGEGGA